MKEVRLHSTFIKINRKLKTIYEAKEKINLFGKL